MPLIPSVMAHILHAVAMAGARVHDNREGKPTKQGERPHGAMASEGRLLGPEHGLQLWTRRPLSRPAELTQEAPHSLVEHSSVFRSSFGEQSLVCYSTPPW